MAGAWGNVVQHWRGGVDAWIINDYPDSAVIRVVCSWQSLGWGYNVPNSNSAYCMCDGQDSGWIAAGGAYSGTGQTVTTTMLTRDFSVSKGYGNDRYVTCTAGFYLGGHHIGTSTASCSVWIGARPYEIPKPPLSPNLSRTSDQSQKLTWSANYTDSSSAYPWAGVYIDRRTDGGSWVTIATVAWSTNNLTDNSTSAGHEYSYGLRSYNSTGASSRVSVGTVRTSPTSPTSARLLANSPTSATLSVSGGSSYVSSWEYQTKLGTGSWGATNTAASMPVTFSFTAGTLTARVRKVTDSGGSGSVKLYSGWVESPSIVTICPPLAPKVTVSGEGGAFDGDGVDVIWVPNHPDASAQTKAEIRLTSDGGTTTYTVTGSSTRYSIPPSALDAGKTYSVTVRTWGVDPGAGALSSPQALSIYVKPEVTITSPALEPSVISVMPLALSWTSTQEVFCNVSLFDSEGRQLGFWTTSSAKSGAIEVTSDQVSLTEGGSYRFLVQAHVSLALSVGVERNFTVKWAPPATPMADVAVDESLGCHVRLAYGDSLEWWKYETSESGYASDLVGADSLPVSEEGISLASREAETGDVDGGVATLPQNAEDDAAQTEYLTVHRINYDGTLTQIGGHFLDAQTAIDPLPPLGVEFCYRVTAHAPETGTTSYKDFPVHITGGQESYSFGQGAGTSVILELDASVSDSVSHTGETFRFALGEEGGNLPTFYPDGDLDATGTRSYVMHDVESYRRLREVARSAQGALCWYRSAWGHRAFGSPTFTLGYEAAQYSLWTVSVSFTETQWEEPVNG